MTNTQNQPTTLNANQGFEVCTMPFDSIQDPGAYVCNWSGHLLRVPQDGVAAGRSPLLNIVGGERLFVTKISDNPYITLTKARLLAANFDINTNF